MPPTHPCAFRSNRNPSTCDHRPLPVLVEGRRTDPNATASAKRTNETGEEKQGVSTEGQETRHTLRAKGRGTPSSRCRDRRRKTQRRGRVEGWRLLDGKGTGTKARGREGRVRGTDLIAWEKETTDRQRRETQAHQRLFENERAHRLPSSHVRGNAIEGEGEGWGCVLSPLDRLPAHQIPSPSRTRTSSDPRPRPHA